MFGPYLHCDLCTSLIPVETAGYQTLYIQQRQSCLWKCINLIKSINANICQRKHELDTHTYVAAAVEDGGAEGE